MSDLTASARLGSSLTRFCYLMGSIGLVAAMLTDAVSVLCRHIGIAFLGSIEIVQVCMVLSSAAAMIIATLVNSHARVHILTDRLDPKARNILLRAGDLLSAAIVCALAAGSIWVASDLWDAQEITDILSLPIRWERAVWIVSAIAIMALFIVRVCRRDTVNHGA